MKLRFFKVNGECYGNGLNSGYSLQYWNKKFEKWENVPSVEVFSNDEEEALIDKDWV